MVKSRRMRWVGYIPYMGVHAKFLSENMKEGDHLGGVGIDRMMIL
jgi:hypothetical protein